VVNAVSVCLAYPTSLLSRPARRRCPWRHADAEKRDHGPGARRCGTSNPAPDGGPERLGQAPRESALGSRRLCDLRACPRSGVLCDPARPQCASKCARSRTWSGPVARQAHLDNDDRPTRAPARGPRERRSRGPGREDAPPSLRPARPLEVAMPRRRKTRRDAERERRRPRAGRLAARTRRCPRTCRARNTRCCRYNVANGVASAGGGNARSSAA
jgi:hypothetical protein